MDRLALWPTRHWRLVAVLAGLLGAGFLGMVGHRLAPSGSTLPWLAVGAMLGGALGAGGILVLYVLVRVDRRVGDAEAQVRALVNIRPLAGPLPLDLGGWAADPVMADTTVRVLLRRKPGLVVECGSGWTTLLIARCLEEMGHGKVIAFEHATEFADRARRLLEGRGAGARAEVVHAPLEDRRIDGRAWSWYGPGAESAVNAPIDVLVVDGPPGHLASRSRYPAVPLLREHLAPACTIVLDDGCREDERWIARQWARELDTEPQLVRGGKGVWLLDVGDDLSSTGSPVRDDETDG